MVKYIKKKHLKTVIIVSVFIMLVAGLGITFGFFSYTKTGQNNKVIAGSLYLTMNEGSDTITITNGFPETKEEARSRTNNTLTFTLRGKNTSLDKAINYEILLNNGTETSGKTRYNTKDLVFDLVEIGANNEETYILDAVSYETLNNQKIWVDKVDENTTSEVSRTYRLRMWISDDVVISDTASNRDYTTTSFMNSYASIKVAVEGDLEEKTLPLVVNVSNVLNGNNESYITNEITNANSENNQDTYTVTVTSSNNNVVFVYTSDATITPISSNDLSSKVSFLEDHVVEGKVVKLTNEEVVTSSFEEEFTIPNNNKVTFTYALRTTTYTDEETDLTYTVAKGNTTVQQLVKHLKVHGNARDVPTIQFVNKTTAYTGSSVTLDSVVIKNSDNTAYSGTTKYTYYKGNNCTGQELTGAPVKPGVYSVKVYAAGSGTDGSTSSCGTITINKKTLTAGIDSCTNRNYNGTTGVTCTTGVSGKVGAEVVSVSGTCNLESATAGDGKKVTCTNLALTGADKDNYELSANSVEKASAINITKPELLVKAEDKSMNAGGSAPTYTYTASGFVNGETASVLSGNVTYSIKNSSGTVITVGASTQVGTYSIIPSGLSSDNYNIVYEKGTLTVIGSVTAQINSCTDRGYTGDTVVSCNITLNGVSGNDNVKVIATCNADSATIGDNKTVTCTNITLTGSDRGKYSLTSTTATKANAMNILKNALTAVVESCNTKTYDGNTTANCTIGARGSSGEVAQVTISGASCTFDNKDVGSDKTVTCTSLTLAPEYTSNYELTNTTATGTAIITKKNVTVTADNKNISYGTSAPTYTYTLTGVVAGDTAVSGNATYTIKSGNTTINDVSTANAGTYDIIPSGLTAGSNYAILYANGTLTIARANTATIGSCKTPTYTGSSQDIVNHGTGVTYSGNEQTNVKTDGNYTITVTPDANHAWSNGDTTSDTLSCNIAKKDVTYKADDATKTYDGTALTQNTVTKTAGDLVTGHTATFVVSGTITNAGTETNTLSSVTIQDGNSNDVTDNYNITKTNGTLTVTRANTATIGSCKTPTYTGSSQDIVNHGTGVTYIGNEQTNVKTDGNYTITVTPDANHAWSNGETTSDTLSCNIAGKAITPVIDSCSNKEYNGNDAASCTYSSVSEKIGSDDVSLIGGSCTFDNKNVGTGKTVTCSSIGLTGSDSDNYTLSTNSATSTANITAKTVTVTADDKTIPYGSSAPTYTYTVTGAIGEETAVNGTATYTIKSGDTVINDVSTASMGTYDIVLGGLTATSNYNATYENGTLTILPPAAVISCSDKTYDGTEQTACSCSGGTIGGEYKATNYRATAYSASCTPDEYHSAPSNVTWTMNKKDVTITSGSSERAWNNSALTDNTCTVTTGSLVTGHTVSCTMTSGSTITTAGTVDNTIDTVTIIDGSSNTVTDNYNVTTVAGTLTVTLATPTVTLTEKANRAYTGSTIAANTATVSPDSSPTITYKYYTDSNCSANETTTAPTNAGTYYAKAYAAAVSGKTAAASSGCVNHSISKINSSTKIDNSTAASGSTTYGTNKTATISSSGDGSLTCSSSNTNVATCSISGSTLTMVPKALTSDNQIATITVTRADGTNYNGSSATYTLTVNRVTLQCPGNATNALTYNGQTQTYAGNTCPSGSSSSSASGINVGTYYGYCTANAGYKFASTCTKATLTINKANSSTKISGATSTSGSTTYGTNKTASITATGNGALTCTSSNTGYATCSISGLTLTMTPKAATSDGSTTITVTQAASTNYNASSATYVLTVNRISLTCNVQTTTPTLTFNNAQQCGSMVSCPVNSTGSQACGTNAGSYSTNCTPNAGYKFASTCTASTLTISRADCSCSWNQSFTSIKKGSSNKKTLTAKCVASFNSNVTATGNVEYTSNDTSILTYVDGVVTGKKVGSTSVKYAKLSSTNYSRCTVSKTISVTN